MNQKLSAKVRDRMEDILETSNLFTLSSKFNSQLNIILLKHLVEEKGLKGVYVSLERPSFYVQRLLKQRGVDLDKITFLDAIQKLSGDKNAQVDPCTRLIENPFASELVENLIGRPHGVLEGDEIDFILVDSLSVLSCYVDDSNLATLLEKLKGRDGITVLMFVDRKCNDELYLRVKQYFKNEINLKDDLTVELVANT